MTVNLYCKIFELKGMISSLSDISEREENMDHPIFDRMNIKMNEIVTEIQEGAVVNAAAK